MVEQTSVRTFVIAALIFAAILTGAMSMISRSVPDEQSRADFGRYESIYDRFDDLNSNTTAIKDKMKDAEPKEGLEGIITGAWDATWGAINLVWSSVTITGAVIGDLSSGTSLGLPSWFTSLIIGIIGITVAFAIIASIRKWYI